MTSTIVCRVSHFSPGVRLFSICALAALACLPLQAQQRLRVAVMTFDVGQEVQQKASRQFAIQEDLGRKLSDLLIDRLVNDGRFIVIERSALDKIIKEQNLSNSDRNDPSSAAKIGKVAGVDAIIIGAVTGFSNEEQESKTGGLVRGLGRFNGTTLEQKATRVKVATTARAVNTSTAEILASATGLGEAEKKQSGLRMANSGTGGVSSSNTSKNFADPLAEQATMQAIATMAMQIEASPAMAPRVAPPAAPAIYNGLVADVTGNAIIINVGAKSGVRVGDTVVITRPLRTIKDPSTGKVIKVVSEKLGEAKVTETDEGSATATYSGTAALKMNDHISNAPTP